VVKQPLFGRSLNTREAGVARVGGNAARVAGASASDHKSYSGICRIFTTFSIVFQLRTVPGTPSIFSTLPR